MCALNPTIVGAGDSAWRLRVSALSVHPTGDTIIVPDSDERIPFTASDDYGLGIDAEYRASRRLGVDFGVLTASPVIDALIDETAMISARGETRFTPVYAGLNLHVAPSGHVDFYFGALLSYVFYTEFDFVTDPWFESESIVTENDLAFGLTLGLDIQLGKSDWLLSASFRYLDTTVEGSPPDGSLGLTEFNPQIFSFGVGYQF
jgi:outer membrane protein W